MKVSNNLNSMVIERENCIKDLNNLISADKSKEWITSDLKVVKIGWLGKVFWPILKHSKILTRLIYGIDPSKTQQALTNFKERVKHINNQSDLREGEELCDLYIKAIEKYNKLFPHHHAEVELTDIYSSHWGYQAAVMRAIARIDCDVHQLLEQAMKDHEPEIALWLVQKKGAVLPKQVPQDQAKLLAWLEKATAKQNPTPENLDHFALEVGYGYKAANLLVLQEEVGKIKLHSAVVKVPPFLPISDYEMKEFIFKFFPDLEEKWKQFLETTFDEKTKSTFLKCQGNDPIPPLQISEEGRLILKEIQTKISNLFTDQSYFSIQIQEWLDKEKPDQIIIRSTGKEDTETNSNAGGNESVPFVKPDRQEISKTIGRVLASYFGEKSISQRLLAGDKTLFTETKPFLPVLLQKMVMEKELLRGKKNPDDIPRSGVLFTAQQDKAHGAIFIQTGLGNNEGVVSSKVAVDTYHVKNGKVHAIVRNKKTRFVRNNQNQAVEVENSDIDSSKGFLATSQSLSNPIVRDLAQVARWASKHYSNDRKSFKSLDMEYSIKLKEQGNDRPVIYLLQARPLVLPKLSEAKPNYVHMKIVTEKIPLQQYISAKVLIDTRNEVQQVKKREEILFTDTLPQALVSYTAGTQKPKVIVIRKSAPATSHESVVLRSKGVTVIVVDEMEEYERMKEFASKANSQNPLMVDTQRGCIVSTQGMANPESLIKQGLISYPMPLEISIPQHFSLQGHKLSQQTAEKHLRQMHQTFVQTVEQDWLLLKKDLISDGKGFYPTKANQPNSKNIRELFEIMATDETFDRREAKRALATILSLIHTHLHQSLKGPHSLLAPYAQPLYHLFCYAVKLSNQEIIPQFNHPPQTLERLYGLKFLEAVIFQQPGEDVVSGFSLATFLRLNQVQKEILIKGSIKKLEDLIIVPCIKHGQEAAISQQIGKKWEDFVSKLKSNEKEMLLKQIEEMRSLNVFSSWLNVIFSSLWPSKAPEEILKEIKQSVLKEKNLLQWIGNNRKKIPSQQQIASWSDPQIAKKECINLKSLFLDSFEYDIKKKELSKRYQQSGPLGKLALVQFIRDTVTVYDTMIKQVSGNVQLAENPQLKATLFADLLSGYFEMMQSVMGIVSFVDEQEMMRVENTVLSFDAYITKLQKGNKYKFGFNNSFESVGFNDLCERIQKKTMPPKDFQEQFEARSIFSVAGMVVGSHIDRNFSVHWPTRLEEYFTTFHQNMEAVCNHLNMKMGLNQNVLSDQPKEVCSKIAAKFKTPLSFIVRSENKVEVVYQIPLRQHAGSLIVTYDPSKPNSGIDIKVHMVGNHEHNRWYQAAFIGAYLGNSVEGLSCTDGVVPNLHWKQDAEKVNSVEFSLHLSDSFLGQPHQLERLVNVLRMTMIDVTMNNFPDRDILAELQLIGDADKVKDGFFSSTFWGLDRILPLVKNDNIKFGKAITNIVKHLIDKEVNCSTFRIGQGNKKIYDIIAENLEEFCFEAPLQFIELIKDLQVLPLEKSNPELANKIKEFAQKYSKPTDILDRQLEKILAKGSWTAVISFVEKFNYKKELIQALGKCSLAELHKLYATIGKSSEERTLAKSLFEQANESLKWDLNREILSKQSEEVCSKIDALFGALLPPCVIGSGDKIQVIYRISQSKGLYETEGSLIVSYDSSKPNNGIEIRLHMAGDHKDDRWYHAALVGAYLGNNIEGLSCVDNIAPSLAWKQPWEEVKEVEFSLRLSESFVTQSGRLDKLVDLLRMVRTSFPTRLLVEKLQSDYGSNKIEDNFFSSNLWGLNFILPLIKEDKDKLSRAMKNIVKFMVEKEVDCATFDINGGKFLYDTLVEYLDVLRRNDLEKFMDLIDNLQTLPIEKSNPKLANKIKELIQKNSVLLNSQFEQAIAKQQWFFAMTLAEKYREKKWREQISLLLNSSPPDRLIKFLLDHYENPKEYDLIKTYLPKKVISSFEQKCSFIQSSCALGSIDEQIFKKIGDFQNNGEEIINLCEKALVGLSYQVDFKGFKSSQPFTSHLSGFLGNQTYSYVYDNNFFESNKLRKGVVLSLIKAMTIPEFKSKAFESVNKLISFYLDYTISHDHEQDVLLCLYALSKAYWQNMDDKGIAKANLRLWWRNDITHLVNLKTSYNHVMYNIPLI